MFSNVQKNEMNPVYSEIKDFPTTPRGVWSDAIEENINPISRIKLGDHKFKTNYSFMNSVTMDDKYDEEIDKLYDKRYSILNKKIEALKNNNLSLSASYQKEADNISREIEELSKASLRSWVDEYKKPVVKPEYKDPINPGHSIGIFDVPPPIYKKAKGILEQETRPTMAKGTMEYETKPITELMMPDGTKWSKEKFVKRYGENVWLKQSKQKYDIGGNLVPYDVYSNNQYSTPEDAPSNTGWTQAVNMVGNLAQSTQNYNNSPNKDMYKQEDTVWDTVGQIGPVGAIIGGVADLGNTAFRPMRESNEKKAGTSGYSSAQTIAGGIFNPLAALQTRGKYEGGYTDISGKGYENYLAKLNKQKQFQENIHDFDANMNQHLNQIDYLQSRPTMAYGGNMTTVYNNGGTHEQNPYGGIPIGDNSLVEEGEIRFDYKDKNKNLKSYIFSNKLKYKK